MNIVSQKLEKNQNVGLPANLGNDVKIGVKSTLIKVCCSLSPYNCESLTGSTLVGVATNTESCYDCAPSLSLVAPELLFVLRAETRSDAGYRPRAAAAAESFGVASLSSKLRKFKQLCCRSTTTLSAPPLKTIKLIIYCSLLN